MLHQKQVNSVLNKHKKRDGWFPGDHSVNPYEGCSCNCLYCYIRGSKILYYKFPERYDPSLVPLYNKLYGNIFFPSFSYKQELKEKTGSLCLKHKIRAVF